MKNKSLKYLISNIKLFPIDLLISILSEILATTAALYISKVIGQTLDLALYPGKVDFEGILMKLVIIALITGFGAVMRFLASFYSGTLSYKTETIMRKNIFEKINTTTLNYIDSIPHGDIVSRIINDLETLGEGIYQVFTQLFSGITVVIGSIILIGKANLSILYLVLGLTPLLFITSWLITKFSYKSFSQYANIQGRLVGFSEEMISNQFVVNAFGYQTVAVDRFEKINEKLYKYGVKSQFLSSLANPSIRLISWIIYASVGTYSAYILISGGNMTIGGISSLLIYVAQYSRPFTDVMGIITQIQSAFASLNRYTEFINMISDKRETSGILKPNECTGKIDIENIFFSYTQDKPILKNFTLHIKPGSKVALIGPTGCGKSTVINLLMRFYNPIEGTIKIDGIPINELRLEELRSMYGMILQDTWLYNASVRENIAYGKPGASIEEIINVAKMANAHNFIKKLNNGYDTVLSANGNGISQGQKQLLSIARVMLMDPKILLLDEATSSIDTRTEIKVQDAFNKLMRGKTSIIVAHRLSTIKNADMIVVMDSGKIIEQGTHEKLLAQKGHYYSLYKHQV